MSIPDLVLSWNRLTKQSNALLAQRLAHVGLNRYFHLIVLIGEGSGLLTQQNLADCLVLDKTALVRIIHFLQQGGWVIRTVNPQDRRQQLLNLTPRAAALVPEIRSAIGDIEAQALKGFSKGEVHQFRAWIRRIDQNFTDLSALPQENA